MIDYLDDNRFNVDDNFFFFFFFLKYIKKINFYILANEKSKILVVEKKLRKVFKFSNAKS